MRGAIAIAALLWAIGASAAEPVHFSVPAGWTVDAARAKELEADVYAADRRTQPTAELVGRRVPKPMVADDAFVRGFISGVKKQAAPAFQEVSHQFLDLGGVRAVRIVADLPVEGGGAVRQAYYVMPVGGETAALVVSDAREAFDARLSEFDEIARGTRGLHASDHVGDEEIGERLAGTLGEVTGVFVVLAAIYFVMRFALARRKH